MDRYIYIDIYSLKAIRLILLKVKMTIPTQSIRRIAKINEDIHAIHADATAMISLALVSKHHLISSILYVLCHENEALLQVGARKDHIALLAIPLRRMCVYVYIKDM